MRVIIDIDEKLYKTTKFLPDYMCGTLQSAIKNGIPCSDVFDAIRTDLQALRGCSCSNSDGIIDDVEDIIDRYAER